MTHRGIEISGTAGNRQLLFNGVAVADGGSGSEGIHADGNDLILDGDVIATCSQNNKLGIYVDDGVLMFGGVEVGGQEDNTYPQGITDIVGVPSSYGGYPEGWHYTNGTMQGAAIYGDMWFQFYDGGHVVVKDILTKTEVKNFNIPDSLWIACGTYEPNHCSSAIFSNEFENIGDTYPLVYITSNGYTCVINLNFTNDASEIHLVRWWYIDNNVAGDTDKPAHAAIGTFDFQNGKGYSIGYPQGIGTGAANHTAGGKFEIIPYDIPQSGSGDLTNSITLDTANKVILQKDVNVTYLNEMEAGVDADWANLQDADFKNGHIFILYGGTNGHENRPKIIDYVPMQSTANAMYTNISKYDVPSGNYVGAEGEGMARHHNGWIVSSLYVQQIKAFVL